MSTSFVQAEKLHPTPFEVEYFDQYDFYSITDRYSTPGGCSRKGRSKREAEDHTNRPNPGGHERKIVLKLQRTEQKRKATPSKE
ncbi:nuclear protein 1-like [Heteronotia binoei]|uniref:nuclear protein 1-like n=1 Tax=Heteronotia binoei TaxID=13085 RepID=UPI00292F97A9|nr:nuclear protein 1-like [Heteronotia binoei]